MGVDEHSDGGRKGNRFAVTREKQAGLVTSKETCHPVYITPKHVRLLRSATAFFLRRLLIVELYGSVLRLSSAIVASTVCALVGNGSCGTIGARCGEDAPTNRMN